MIDKKMVDSRSSERNRGNEYPEYGQNYHPSYSRSEIRGCDRRADKFDVQQKRLPDDEGTDKPEREFMLDVTDDTVVTNYLTAVRRQNHDVMDELLCHIRRNFSAVNISVDFLSLPLNIVTVFLRDSQLQMESECDVFLAALRWIKYNKGDRLRHAADVLKCVRFSRLSPNDILEFVEPNLEVFAGDRERSMLTSIYRTQMMILSGLAQCVNEPARQYTYRTSNHNHISPAQPKNFGFNGVKYFQIEEGQKKKRQSSMVPNCKELNNHLYSSQEKTRIGERRDSCHGGLVNTNQETGHPENIIDTSLIYSKDVQYSNRETERQTYNSNDGFKFDPTITTYAKNQDKQMMPRFQSPKRSCKTLKSPSKEFVNRDICTKHESLPRSEFLQQYKMADQALQYCAYANPSFRNHATAETLSHQSPNMIQSSQFRVLENSPLQQSDVTARTQKEPFVHIPLERDHHGNCYPTPDLFNGNLKQRLQSRIISSSGNKTTDVSLRQESGCSSLSGKMDDVQSCTSPKLYENHSFVPDSVFVYERTGESNIDREMLISNHRNIAPAEFCDNFQNQKQLNNYVLEHNDLFGSSQQTGSKLSWFAMPQSMPSLSGDIDTKSAVRTYRIHRVPTQSFTIDQTFSDEESDTRRTNEISNAEKTVTFDLNPQYMNSRPRDCSFAEDRKKVTYNLDLPSVPCVALFSRRRPGR